MDWRNNLTFKELNNILTFTTDIIENLDNKAVEELISGSERDVDNIIEMIMKEAHSILTIPNRKLDVSHFDSLDSLSESIEENLRKESLNYFLLSVLPSFILNVYHLEWGNFIQLYDYLCIQAPRNHGKSHFFSLGYPLWKMYRYEKDTPYKEAPKRYKMSKEGMIITNEYKLANHLLGIIKSEIEENDILRNKLFPDTRKDGWGAESIITKNGAKLSAKSVGSKMRGYHPHYIICDDYLNDQVLYSTEQNTKYINHFHSVTMNMIEPQGQVIVVGTPFREDDLYANIKKDNSWAVFEYPAIYPDGRVLWPEKFSLDKLLEKRVSQGTTIFSREMLVRPISTESSLFPHPMLKGCFDEKLVIVPNIYSCKRRYKNIVLSGDFAISANIGADYSVFTILGVTENDHYDILHIWRKSGATYDEQTGVIKRLYNDFSPNTVLVEDNGMQKIFVQMLNDMGVPAIGQTTTAQSKYDLHKGIPHMAALFEQGRIHIPRGDQVSIDTTDILVGELTNFTYDEDKRKIQGIGTHDDTCMSLWLAICATKLGSFSFDFI